MPNSSKRSTIHDVARIADVSAQTVSRVINHSTGVKKETRAHVLRVMRELDYHPNRAAQMLATQQSHVLEVITMDIGYSDTFKEAVISTARTFGYQVVFSGVTSAEYRSTIKSAASRLIDGLVLIPAQLVVNVTDAELIELAQGIPFLMVAISVGSLLPSVVCDQAYGTQLATQHLIDRGHRQIAEISGPMNVLDAAIRHSEWVNTLQANGLPPGPHVESTFRVGGGYQAAQRLLDGGAPFTSLVAGNDRIALGAIHALRERGLRIPDDVSVVGFDNMEESAYFAPPLTTVFQDFETMGLLVVEYLIDLIEKPDTPKYQRVLTPSLVVRQSTRSIG
jgi:LacI family transcriptional regulator